MASFAAAVGQGLLAAFVYLVPAVSIAFLLRGISDPRREGWEIEPQAAIMKARYVRFVRWGRRLNHALAAVFVVHVAAFIAFAGEACDATRSHLAGAAANVTATTDLLFLVGFGILVLLDGIAVGWSVSYLLLARRERWPDPRRRDYLVVHAVLVPLALLILWVGFGVTGRLVCGVAGLP